MYELEYKRKINEGHDPLPCPRCSNKMKLQISKTSFILKGKNWAKDGYGGK